MISKTFSLTPAHYKIRILVSMWLTNPSASNGNWTKIQFKNASTGATINTISNNSLSVAAQGGYQIYPTGYRAINIDN